MKYNGTIIHILKSQITSCFYIKVLCKPATVLINSKARVLILVGLIQAHIISKIPQGLASDSSSCELPSLKLSILGELTDSKAFAYIFPEDHTEIQPSCKISFEIIRQSRLLIFPSTGWGEKLCPWNFYRELREKEMGQPIRWLLQSLCYLSLTDRKFQTELNQT